MSRRGERGYVMVALLAAIAILLLGMGAAAPPWKYVMKDAREEELLFRGAQIADAISRYQRKNGNALPTSIDVLVKGKFLRQAYKDPMTKDGEWRLLRPGETGLAPGVVPGAPSSRPPGAGPPGTGGGGVATPTPSPTPTPRASSFGAGGLAGGVGPIAGVASRSTEESLRIFNGRTRYNEWIFAPGLPRVIGRPQAPQPRQPGGAPGAGSPRPQDPRPRP
ncbi:MAG: hypothetical protein NDJ94_13145 [Vicinamibacteria bacterium]|nr:hypothetical protein [Vicinamibacteria bacterium]